MDVQISSRALPVSEWSPVAKRRLRTALRRLAWWVRSVRVHLDDENGPRGGVDTRCCVQLRTRQGDELVLNEVAADWRSAFERALARLVRTLTGLHRRRSTPRPAARRGRAADPESADA